MEDKINKLTITVDNINRNANQTGSSVNIQTTPVQLQAPEDIDNIMPHAALPEKPSFSGLFHGHYTLIMNTRMHTDSILIIYIINFLIFLDWSCNHFFFLFGHADLDLKKNVISFFVY